MIQRAPGAVAPGRDRCNIPKNRDHSNARLMLACQRHLFQLPEDGHYLNCAYMAPLPRAVEQAGIEGIQRKRHPSQIRAEDFFEDSDRVRRLFARLIGADSRSIAIIPSVSYGIATAARNVEIGRGQKIIVAHEQFPSNVYRWRQLAGRRGADVVTIGPGDAGRGDAVAGDAAAGGSVAGGAGEGDAGRDDAAASRNPVDARAARWNERIMDAIDASTAVVALANVHWTDGTRFDLESIGERARDVGAALIIDGTQSVGALPFDVRKIRPTALICAGYKWLFGPYSMALAYFSESMHDGIPLEDNWISRRHSEQFSRLVNYEEQYQPGAIRYDVGERSNFILIPMMSAALELVREWTPEAVQEYCRHLTEDLVREARFMGYRIEQESGRGYHLFGIRFPPSVNAEVLRKELDARRISVSVRGNALRISPHVYNDAADADALRDALAAAVKNPV